MRELFSPELLPPPGLVVVSYGGGVNSVAMLILLARHGITPHAITMADPGSERADTIRFRDVVMPTWLDAHGFPPITVIDRISEGQHVARAWRLETLRDECMRINALPSVAYGWKKCSAKYKGDPHRWWLNRQPWAHAEWDAGRRIVKAIGYDTGEPTRALSAMRNTWEAPRLVPWYPLRDAGLDREECEELIADEGLPPPPKSACTFCPNNTLAEWEALRRDEPERFAEAVEMSRNAQVEAPDVVGLMRCSPHGKRQLHVWADGGYGALDPMSCGREDAMPCECAT